MSKPINQSESPGLRYSEAAQVDSRVNLGDLFFRVYFERSFMAPLLVRFHESRWARFRCLRDRRLVRSLSDDIGEIKMMDNYDLMSLICGEVSRQLGIDPDIDNPKFEKLYDDISQPILALLDARDERSI